MTRELADARALASGLAGGLVVGSSLLGPQSARMPVGLVARDRELAELERALAHCRQGDSALVVLRGEPGTGKSALLAAVASRARDFEVVQLRASASGGEVRGDWPRALADLLDVAGAVDATALAERFAAALSGLGLARAPTLVSIDDAQLLDGRFLSGLVAALEHGVVAHPVLVVLAVTDVPNAPEVDLAVGPTAVCRLGGLTAEQAALLLERVFGREPRGSIVRALVHAVGGNPQALLAVGGLLEEDVLKGWQPLPDPVPLEPSLRHAFGACLEDLSPETRAGLATAAAGRIPRKILEGALGDLGLDLSCFDPAVERGIIVVQRSRIAFGHPLVRAAAYHGASEQVRARAHQALSHAFASAGLVEPSAVHAARSAVSTTAVLGLYGQAVRVALDRADLTLAAQYQETMAAIGGSDEAVVQHLTRAAAWWMSAGELDRAQHCLEQAATLPATEELRGSLSYWRSRARMAVDVDVSVADDLEAAAALVQQDASGSAALMLGEAAICLLVGGQAERADELARRTVEAADAVGGLPEAFAGAVAASVRVLGHLGPEGTDGLRSATSFLVSQPDALPLSPLFATVVGLALLAQGGANATETWAAWLEQNAASTGNVSLAPVSGLLGAHVAMRRGRLDEAGELAAAAADAATAHGQRVVAVRALATLLEAQSLRGDYQAAFVTASRLFADAAEGDRHLRAVAYRALAELELQRARVPSALSWLKAAEFEVTSKEGHAAGSVDPRVATWVAVLAEVHVHDDRPDAVAPLVEVVERAAHLGAVAAAWSPAMRAVVTVELASAEELFNAALRLARDEPALRARVEYLYAARLAAEGLADRAARRLQSAVTTMRDLGALGWATHFELAIERLDAAAPSRPDLAVLSGGGGGAGLLPLAAHPAGADRASARPSRLEAGASWEITMLGSFGVRHEDSLISMPSSLAATALKLVALRRRILVEELVEELWPGSAPGVGMRRLRNVLWRVRVACGEILVREDKLILLSSEAVTDVEVFRRLAVQALDPSTPVEKGAELARTALALYDGELLPMDRYADWAAATRESLSRLRIQLVELQVRNAIGDERIHEALALLDQLIEADPYEESHYLRVAELHEKAGNRRRALSTLARAERTLFELGIPPSPDLKRLTQRLS